MRVSHGRVFTFSIVMVATAWPLMAQETPVVDLGASDVRGFDDRSRRRKGAFIGPEQLDKLAPLLFQDIVAGRNDAVTVDHEQKLVMRTLNERAEAPSPPETRTSVDRRSGAVPLGSSMTIPSKKSEPFCAPEVFVDNLWISRGGSAVSLGRLDERWGAASVVAVEIYESPWSIPENFSPVLRGGGPCGLIAFWTSRRQYAAP